MSVKPTAIVIEDDSRLALLFNANCSMAGFHSEVVLTGYEAMSYLQRQPSPQVNLVLLDMYLPGVGGELLLKHLKENFPDTIVIIITADPVMADKHRGEVEWSLAKPVSWVDLKAILFQAFERIQSHKTVSTHPPVI
jgi:DNA-binding response OmpR family regulator